MPILKFLQFLQILTQILQLLGQAFAFLRLLLRFRFVTGFALLLRFPLPLGLLLLHLAKQGVQLHQLTQGFLRRLERILEHQIAGVNLRLFDMIGRFIEQLTQINPILDRKGSFILIIDLGHLVLQTQSICGNRKRSPLFQNLISFQHPIIGRTNDLLRLVDEVANGNFLGLHFSLAIPFVFGGVTLGWKNFDEVNLGAGDLTLGLLVIHRQSHVGDNVSNRQGPFVKIEDVSQALLLFLRFHEDSLFLLFSGMGNVDPNVSHTVVVGRINFQKELGVRRQLKILRGFGDFHQWRFVGNRRQDHFIVGDGVAIRFFRVGQFNQSAPFLDQNEPVLEGLTRNLSQRSVTIASSKHGLDSLG